MTNYQRLTAFLFLLLLIALAILTATGELVNTAVEFFNSIDTMNIVVLTLTVIAVVFVVATLLGSSGIIGLSTGFIYGRRIHNPVAATAVACTVALVGIIPGYLTCHALGSTVLLNWAQEFQRRNPIFEALDTVIVHQGLKVGGIDLDLLVGIPVP